MRNSILGFAALLLSSTATLAAPTVDGLTISWPDDGWYQVQDETTFAEVCSGGLSCVVEPGSYVVINHSTGERFNNIVVTDGASMDESSFSETTETTATTLGSTVTLVTQTCFGAPNTRNGCTAFCPADTVATGGGCDVSFGYTVSSVPGTTYYRCSTALPPNDSTVGVTARAYCLGSQ